MVAFICSDNASVNVPFEAACAYFGLVRDLARDTTDFAAGASNPTIHVPATGREMNIVIECCRSATITQNKLTTFLQCSELDWPSFARRTAAGRDPAKPEPEWFTEAIRRKMLRTAIKCHMDLEFITAIDRGDAGYTEYAATCGTPEVLRYFMEKYRGAFPARRAFEAAVNGGNLECVEELYKFGEPSPHDAEDSGSPEVMQYLMERGGKINKYMCRYFAERGNLAALKIACENGNGIDRDAVSGALNGGKNECLQYAIDKARATGVSLAGITYARVRSLRSLEILEDHGIDLPEIEDAAAGGNVEAVKFLLARGKRMTCEAAEHASHGGFLECLKYLHEHGCPWKSDVINAAIEFGYYDILVYAAENGCPCKITAARYAVECGRPDHLRYLLETGRACDASVVKAAIDYNRADCLALLRAHGYA